jgi:hypothetical protein
MKKRIADLPPEDREKVRAYNRELKAKSRAKQKAVRHVPTADEAADNFAADHFERLKELDQYVKDFAAKVSKELDRASRGIDEEYVIDRVVRCLIGLKNGWVQEVTQPDGEIVSGAYFADACGDMVQSANRHGLKQSPAFLELYTDLLILVDRRYGHQQTEDAAIVKAELAGRYELPPLPELPKPEPQKPTEKPLPSMAEILERGRIELLSRIYPDPQQPHTQVNDTKIAPAARRYLDGR